MPVPEDGIPGWTRANLNTALQACDSHALVAFYSHFRPILAERASLFGIPHAERADAVETFLGDLLIKLCSGLELPKSIHAYVFVSFKRYAFRIGHAKRVETDNLVEFATALTPPVRAVAEQSAHYSAENPALSRFAAALLADLTVEDKLILGARAEEMPLREVASILGMNYNAANTRLFRLRSKLKMNAPGIVSRMDVRDRPIIERFLRRAREQRLPLSRLDPPIPAKARQGGV